MGLRSKQKNIASGYTTNASHLRRLGRLDENAWDEFYTRYRTMIWGIGAQHDLSEVEQADLLQEVAQVCMKRLSAFVYDPERCRFRTFLYRIVRNCAFNIRRKRTPRSAAVPEDYPDVAGLDREFMREYEDFLLGRSLRALARAVDSETYFAFELLVLEERPVPEVAALTGKSAGALYSLRHRCLGKLRAIIADLEKRLETPPETDLPARSHTASPRPVPESPAKAHCRSLDL